MIRILFSFFSWLAAFIGKDGVRRATEFTAYRAMYLFLFVTVLPYVLVKVFLLISSYVFNYASTQMDVFSPLVIQTTGLLAWLLNCFQIPYIFTVLMSAYAVRYSIRFFRLLLH